MNRPARFTAADLRRAVKVAAQQGPEFAVEVDGNGTIRIVQKLRRDSFVRTPEPEVEAGEEIVL